MRWGLLVLLGAFHSTYGEVQYKPIASSLNHGVSTGMALELPSGKKRFFSKNGVFLNYTYYFSSWDKWLPEKYQGYLNWGLSGGADFFFYSRNLCGSQSYQNRPLLIQGNLQARIVYWERIQPFAGVGISRLLCHENLKRIEPSSVKLKQMLFFGISLSLKSLDRRAIYSLDEDYGLNDMALVFQCLQIKKTSESKNRFVCQVGLEVLF